MQIVMVGEEIEGDNNALKIQSNYYFQIFSSLNGDIVRGKKCTFDSHNDKGAGRQRAPLTLRGSGSREASFSQYSCRGGVT